MLRSSNYLTLKPSQVAAAAIILAINLSSSDLASKVGLQKMQDLNLRSLFSESLTNTQGEARKSKVGNVNCPLKIWNKMAKRVTTMNINEDLRPAYTKMCTIVNEFELQGQLSTRPDLFLLTATKKTK